MVFSSILFLFRFLPAVLLLYVIAPRSWKNAVLFLASLFFYAWGEPVYVVLMLFSTVVDYTHGRLVNRFLGQGKRGRAKWTVASSMVINLLLLGFFKYADFLVANLNQLLGTNLPLLQLGLPIGISFYTFQTMSYTIDIYRGDAKVQKNIIAFGAYVALFPQLIAGPIVRYKTVASELDHRRMDADGFGEGALRFSAGLAKKVLLANQIGLLWEQISAGSTASMPALTAWIGILAFAFQIYFDFSGYSDMAIGLGRMFGFHFPENFDHPYESASITEFWRRWHISLGTWFREYVYIPLGGNRKGPGRQVFNLAVVWLLTGIWHGASWNFVAWGAYFGILLIVEKLFLLKILERLPRFAAHAYALFLILFGWVIFAFEDLSQGAAYLGAMFGSGGSLADGNTVWLFMNYGVLLLILILGSTGLPARLAGRFRDNAAVKAVFLTAMIVLSVAFLVNASYNPFLYFRF